MLIKVLIGWLSCWTSRLRFVTSRNSTDLLAVTPRRFPSSTSAYFIQLCRQPSEMPKSPAISVNGALPWRATATTSSRSSWGYSFGTVDIPPARTKPHRSRCQPKSGHTPERVSSWSRLSARTPVERGRERTFVGSSPSGGHTLGGYRGSVSHRVGRGGGHDRIGVRRAERRRPALGHVAGRRGACPGPPARRRRSVRERRVADGAGDLRPGSDVDDAAGRLGPRLRLPLLGPFGPGPRLRPDGRAGPGRDDVHARRAHQTPGTVGTRHGTRSLPPCRARQPGIEAARCHDVRARRAPRR